MKKKIAIFAAAALLVAGGSFVLKGVLNNSSLFDANVDALAKPVERQTSTGWEVVYPKPNSPDHNCRRGGSDEC